MPMTRVVRVDNFFLQDELLISRLIRAHWDRTHLERVKQEYHKMYRKSLAERIKGETSGYYRDMLLEVVK